MEEWLGANWQFVVGTALTLLLFLPAIYLPLSKYLTMDWDYREIANFRYKAHPYAPGLVVSYNGNALVEPYLMVITLRNPGFREIVPTDFHSPLTITLGSGKPIAIQVQQRNMQPELPIETTISDQTITFAPLLVNRRDRIDLAVLVEGRPKEPTAMARIAGATRKRIRRSVGRGSIILAYTFLITVSATINTYFSRHLTWQSRFRSALAGA